MIQQCIQCGKEYTPHPEATKKSRYCGKRCRAQKIHETDRETAWLLMELVRQLWSRKPEDFEYQPRPLPQTVEAWREEYNRLGYWIRGLNQ
jgi:hypothetical protein